MMKRALAAFALIVVSLLAPPPPAYAQSWAHTDSCNNDVQTSGSTVTCVFSATLASGAMVAGCAQWASSTGTVSSVTDDKSNTYTVRSATLHHDTSNGWSNECWSGENFTNAPKTLTITYSSSTSERQVYADAYTGQLLTGAFDQAAGQALTNPGTGANALTSGNVTTTANGELIWGSIGSSSSATPNYTAGTGFTKRVALNSGRQPMTEDMVQSSAGVVAATATDNTSSDKVFADVMTFMPAAGGGGGGGSTPKALPALGVGSRSPANDNLIAFARRAARSTRGRAVLRELPLLAAAGMR